MFVKINDEVIEMNKETARLLARMSQAALTNEMSVEYLKVWSSTTKALLNAEFGYKKED